MKKNFLLILSIMNKPEGGNVDPQMYAVLGFSKFNEALLLCAAMK